MARSNDIKPWTWQACEQRLRAIGSKEEAVIFWNTMGELLKEHENSPKAQRAALEESYERLTDKWAQLNLQEKFFGKKEEDNAFGGKDDAFTKTEDSAFG